MYVPERFREEHLPEILGFVKAYGLATLITQRADGTPIGTHLPLELAEPLARPGSAPAASRLIGHVAAANEQWRTFEHNPEVLAIFTGPHAFITPRWYDQVNVPTWNYVAVHAYGVARAIHDREEKIAVLRCQLALHEGEEPGAFRLEDLTPDSLDAHLAGIVAVDIAVTRWNAAFKLSQNRHARDHRNVIAELERRSDAGSRGVAEWMRKKSPHR